MHNRTAWRRHQVLDSSAVLRTTSWESAAAERLELQVAIRHVLGQAFVYPRSLLRRKEA